MCFTIRLTSSQFDLTWKSNIPTAMKSAPLRKAWEKPSLGRIAPAANTLKAIHGFRTVFMKATVSSAWMHHMLSKTPGPPSIHMKSFRWATGVAVG